MTMLLYCSDPMNPSQPDEAYHNEAKAAESLNLDYTIFSFEALVHENNPIKAMKRIPEIHDNQLGIYRGWMLKPKYYQRLYDALRKKNIQLINTPEAYIHCHYLPQSYNIIKPYTPKSIWLHKSDGISIDKIMEILKSFGSRPVIVKDFVKSLKHYWHEACFIPSASNRNDVERAVGKFLKWQDEDLNEGLVFREYVELEPLTTHSKSQMPLSREYRIFVFDGQPVYTCQYWEEGDYDNITPNLEPFGPVLTNVKSRFFTLDIARRKDG
ncbi:MAG: ATP-grasp domain-containing protein, partial [Sedimentisphaerales bacterium]|nr:ATP-grasp domain-containing protein [Sedimentisphaerales bacterium]